MSATEPSRPRRDLLAVLAAVLVLQIVALLTLDGYQLADSTEYLDRADRLAQGLELVPSSRSFAFSALHVPIFLVADWIGLDDYRAAVLLARLFQMALGLCAAAVLCRVGERLFDRRAGLAAALLFGTNPVFLQWSVEPLSGTAATLCVVLAFAAAVQRGEWRQGLVVGLWLGAAFLMAFQTIMVLAAFAGALLLRERWSGRSYLAGAALGVGACVLVQCVLDRLVYGGFGVSLWNYLVENFAGTASTWMYEIGGKTGIGPLQDAGLWLYNQAFEGVDAARQAARAEAKSQAPRDWYVAHLHTHLLAWPALLCLALGLVRSAFRPSWPLAIAVLTVVSNVLIMSVKGSQSFRLWLPLVPLVALLAGAGWAWAYGRAESHVARRAAAVLLLAAAAALSADLLRDRNRATYGGYWDAMAFVNAAARDAVAAGDPLPRVSSGYHWAVRFRDAPEVELVKLPAHLNEWGQLLEDERAAVLAELDTLDWFVSHLQLIEQDAAILDVLGRRFEVAAAFWEPDTFWEEDTLPLQKILPILVLRRRTGDPEAATLFDVHADADPGAYQARLDRPRSIDFRRLRPDGTVEAQLVLLGWDLRVLPGTGAVPWLTLHWFAGPTAGHDYTVSLRVTDADDRALQRNRRPAWGVYPTSAWEPGWIVSEGIPLALPATWDGFGGAHCRGDLLPARLWLAVPEYAEVDGVLRRVGGLNPFRPSGRRPIGKKKVGGELVSEEGYTFSPDNLFLAGGLWLSVPETARVPDDGRRL